MLSKEQLEKIANPRPVDIGGTQNPIVTQMAIELLESRAESPSLREQLAELKALPPTGFVKIDPYTENCRWDSSDPDYLAGPVTPEGYGSDYIPLFTATKPAGSVILPAPANYEDYGPMISLEKTMAALALCGIEYTVKK
ncbi:hypothetical protein [Yersinia intermedia]|uniref:hypothetical protein n=1 Tax=Yersinia intermedia TaxID=631 RepID=UPI0011A79BD6|nr:hypothetical protein [Yersinia intermedia]